MRTNASKGVGLIEGKPFGKSATADDVAETLKVAAAGMSDASAIVEVVAEAFANDPTWTWAFPNPSIRKRWWQFCVNGALRYPWVFKTEGYEVASVWIPPSGSEFTDEDIERVPTFLQESLGARAPEVTELLSRFEKAHPHQEPHYYLSLLATADRHRGRGLGMALLRENLARIDREGMPAYLESSNPLNNHRYEALGFKTVARFEAPGNGPAVTGMWRERR